MSEAICKHKSKDLKLECGRYKNHKGPHSQWENFDSMTKNLNLKRGRSEMSVAKEMLFERAYDIIEEMYKNLEMLEVSDREKTELRQNIDELGGLIIPEIQDA